MPGQGAVSSRGCATPHDAHMTHGASWSVDVGRTVPRLHDGLVRGAWTPRSRIRRENELKEWRRAWKIRLVQECNPNWDDLGRHDPRWGRAVQGEHGPLSPRFPRGMRAACAPALHFRRQSPSNPCRQYDPGDGRRGLSTSRERPHSSGFSDFLGSICVPMTALRARAIYGAARRMLPPGFHGSENDAFVVFGC